MWETCVCSKFFILCGKIKSIWSSFAKIYLVAGTISASTEERVHVVLQNPISVLGGTVWPFWTLIPVLMKSCWLWGSWPGNPGHDLTRISEAKLWGSLASECVYFFIFDVWHLYISHLLYFSYGRCMLCVLISSHLFQDLNNVITDMVWDRGIQSFIFAPLMCLLTFAVITALVTTDCFTSNIIKGVTPLAGGMITCYWVRTLTMTPSRIFSCFFFAQ